MCAVNHEWLTNASAGHHIYQTIQSKLFPRAARRMERGVGGGVRPGPRQHILQTNEPCKFRFASSDSAVAPGPRFGPVVLKLQAHTDFYIQTEAWLVQLHMTKYSYFTCWFNWVRLCMKRCFKIHMNQPSSLTCHIS